PGPEEQEHDAVGAREQPRDQPEPAAEPRRELGGELKRTRRCVLHGRTSLSPSQATGVGGAAILAAGFECGMRSTVRVHFGIHQLALPSKRIVAGTSKA